MTICDVEHLMAAAALAVADLAAKGYDPSELRVGTGMVQGGQFSATGEGTPVQQAESALADYNAIGGLEGEVQGAPPLTAPAAHTAAKPKAPKTPKAPKKPKGSGGSGGSKPKASPEAKAEAADLRAKARALLAQARAIDQQVAALRATVSASTSTSSATGKKPSTTGAAKKPATAAAAGKKPKTTSTSTSAKKPSTSSSTATKTKQITALENQAGALRRQATQLFNQARAVLADGKAAAAAELVKAGPGGVGPKAGPAGNVTSPWPLYIPGQSVRPSPPRLRQPVP